MARIGDVFASWARGDRLNHSEIEQVRRTMNEMQQQSRQASNVIDDTGSLSDTVYADKYWEEGPLSGTLVIASAPGPNIPNATWTALEFETLRFERHGIVKWDSASPTKLVIPTRFRNATRHYMILGWMDWVSDAVGERSVRVTGYDAGDGLVGSAPLDQRNAVGGGVNTTCCFMYPFNYTTNMDYFTVEVHQNSGGALELSAFRVYVGQLF